MRTGHSTLPRTLSGPWAAAAFAAGILASRLAVPPTTWLILTLHALVATCLAARAGGRARRASPVLWTLAVVALGGWRASSVPVAESDHRWHPSHDAKNGLVTRVRVRVINPPVVVHGRGRGERRSLLCTVCALDSGKPLHAQVGLAEGERPPDLGVHDVVELTGLLWAPRSRGNPGDHARRSHRAPGTIVVPSPNGVRRVDDPIVSSSQAADRVRTLRAHLHRTIERLHGSRSHGIVLSILLGDRRLLDRDVRDDLVATGTFHFLAISGLHVGVVMLLVLRVPLPRGGRTLVRLGLLAAFALLTGGHVPVLRASLMVAVHVLLTRTGRRPRPLNVLGWTAAVFLAVDPHSVADPGLQLSFVAVAGILLYAGDIFTPTGRSGIERFLPRPRQGSKGERLRRVLRPLLGALAVSIASSAATAPLIAYHFQRFHPLAPLWSLTVYPLVLVVLLGAIAGVALGSVLPSLGVPLALVVDSAVAALSKLLQALAEVPGSCQRVPRPSVAAEAGSYALLLLGSCSRSRRAALAAAAVALGTLVLVSFDPPRHRIVHLDVGGASTTCVEAPGVGLVLIDAGARSSSPGRGLVDSILGLGHRRVDEVFLSHPHRDHVGGLPDLLDELDLRTVRVSTRFDDALDGRQLLASLTRRGVRVQSLRRGDALRFPAGSDLRIEVLFPDEDEALPLTTRPNDMSLGLRLHLADGRFLFLGDLEEQGVARLLESREDLVADVLVLPHHGRRNERYTELIDRVSPREIVISGDGRGGGREIVTWLRRRGCVVYPTWEGGAVIHELDSSGWRTRWWVDADLSRTEPQARADTVPGPRPSR